jgi:hypothetical protein
MNKTVNVPVCIFSKASIHSVLWTKKKYIYKYLGGLVGGTQEAFAQGSINGWANTEWHIQKEEQQTLETQMM